MPHWVAHTFQMPSQSAAVVQAPLPLLQILRLVAPLHVSAAPLWVTLNSKRITLPGVTLMFKALRSKNPLPLTASLNLPLPQELVAKLPDDCMTVPSDLPVLSKTWT